MEKEQALTIQPQSNESVDDKKHRSNLHKMHAHMAANKLSSAKAILFQLPPQTVNPFGFFPRRKLGALILLYLCIFLPIHHKLERKRTATLREYVSILQIVKLHSSDSHFHYQVRQATTLEIIRYANPEGISELKESCGHIR